MLSSLKIRVWVLGMLFIWLVSAMAPSFMLFATENSDTIEITGNLDEESQEKEKKEADKKDWVLLGLVHFKIDFTHSKGPIITKQLPYKTPTHEVVVPPPKLI